MPLHLYSFLFLSFIAILFGLLTVLSKNPVHSVIYLIVCFFAISGHYLLLNAQFLAVVHIIVYAGAIMVLFLSTIMLMNLNETTEQHKPALAKIGATIAACILGMVLLSVVIRASNLTQSAVVNSDFASIKNLGIVLLDEYMFPFEFTSILLLSAMIGAVLLTKREKPLAN